MRQLLSTLALVLAMAPGSVSAQQLLNLYVGGFVPRGEDARSRDDVLVNNLDFLAFYLEDFDAPTVGEERLVGLAAGSREDLVSGFRRAPCRRSS